MRRRLLRNSRVLVFLVLAFLPRVLRAQGQQGGERLPHAGKETERDIEEFWKRDVAIRGPRVGPLHTQAYRTALDNQKAGRLGVRDDIAVTWGEFLSGTGEYFVAVQLSRGADPHLKPGETLDLFGEITDSSGHPSLSFETTAEVKASRDQLYAEVPLRLAPGGYTALIGVGSHKSPRFMKALSLDPRAIAPEAFGASRIILSEDVFPLPAPQRPDDPFAFGGMKVVPRGDGRFRPGDDLWAFVVVRNPAVGEGDAPRLGAHLVVEGPAGSASKRRTFQVADPTPMAMRGFRGQWGLGVPLKLEDFVPGSYGLSLELTDRTTSLSLTDSARFEIVATTADATRP